MPPRRRTRAFRITWFLGNLTWTIIHAIMDTVKCQYMIYQEEICPETHRRHVQGYVYFENGKSLERVRSIFQGADIRLADLKPKVNKAYCSKLESRMPGGRARERGTLPDQGARMDIQDAMEDIRNGMNDRMMFEKHLLLWARYARVLKQYRSDLVEPRNHWTQTTVFWGKTGIGKTTRALWTAQQNPGTIGYLLIPRDGKDMVWGDGCITANTVVIEDMGSPGEINYTVLKRMLDWGPCPMPVKGTHMQWAPHFVIITSNYDPQTWYAGEEWTAEHNPLCRRLTTNGSSIIHMKQQWIVPVPDTPVDSDEDVVVDLFADNP